MIEFLFAIYLISGPLKSFVVYYKLPVPFDVTLGSFLLLAMAAGLEIARNRHSVRLSARQVVPLSFLLLFFFWMSLTLSFSPSPRNSFDKTFNFLTVILAFLIPCCMANINKEKFARIHFAVALVMSFIFIWTLHRNYIVNWTASFSNFNANYLNLSEHVGVGVLGILSCPVIFGHNPYWRMAAVPLGLGTVLLMGGRGPLLFLIMCAAWYAVTHSHAVIARFDSKRVLNSLILVAVAIGAIGVLSIANRSLVFSTAERTFARFSKLIPALSGEGELGASAQERIKLFDHSIELLSTGEVETFLAGHGVGSFGLLATGQDSRQHPHNIVLETTVEMGFIGTVLLLLFFTSVLVQGRMFLTLPRLVIVFMLMNAFKSHSLMELRLMFGLLGLFVSPHIVAEVRQVRVPPSVFYRQVA